MQKTVSWLSVPQFGDWDQKGGALPDYSLDFSKIREMRKQNKRDPSRASLGNEEDFINPTAPANNRPQSEENQRFTQNHSPTVRYLNWLHALSAVLFVFNWTRSRFWTFATFCWFYLLILLHMVSIGLSGFFNATCQH